MPRPNAHLAVGAGIALVSAVVLVSTAGDYGITWDEPTYFGIADGLRTWFSEVVGGGLPGLGQSFEPSRMARVWVFARPENRNLPFPVLLSCLGQALGGSRFGPPVSYRLGHCLLFALTVGILYVSLARRHGFEAAAVASGSLLLMPPVFAHAHFAATDVPVSCFWLLGILAWPAAGNRLPRAALTGLVCGLGLASKATLLVLPAVLLLWIAAFRRGSSWRALLVVLAVAALVVLALCPMWWGHPLTSAGAYVLRVLHAGERWKTDSYYLGTSYREVLPWHNAFVLPAVTTPPVTLVLALVGAAAGLRRRDPEAGLFVLGAAALPALRLLPGAAGHDGARLLMPSLVCLAPLAGLGFAAVRDRVLPGPAWAPVALAVLVLGPSVRSVAALHPYESSYYSEGIGGLPGAERLGFEITYWFDAYTPGALQQVQLELPPGARVWTAPGYTGYEPLRSWGRWRPDLVTADRTDADYLVLYSRKGFIYGTPGLPEIYEHGVPLWALRHQGVQLLALYRLRDREASAGP